MPRKLPDFICQVGAGDKLEQASSWSRRRVGAGVELEQASSWSRCPGWFRELMGVKIAHLLAYHHVTIATYNSEDVKILKISLQTLS